ncbi:hypothetical protein B0H17DRAFT_1132842 [Mycena rosella]|uniref:DUF5648 domain-containing protein n=1 Tax=Mycena rosella TaxID=1033263 RepID=A0AAD7GIR7_MYCRO|nr:hypothetical protein B0H17DRAFT_1132842 [Mycena rosella]
MHSTGQMRTQRRSADTCGNPTDALPFYRSYNPTSVDHFYCSNLNQVNTAITQTGYSLQEVAAMVFVTQKESTVPFYHLWSGPATDSFYTISTTERDNAVKGGYRLEATTEFIYPTQVCGSVPLYRLYHATKLDNFYTTSESERLDFIANQGYNDIEIAGYVLPVMAGTQCD